jgi:hypothetical protein
MQLREALIADDCDRMRRIRCVSLAGRQLATAAGRRNIANGRGRHFSSLMRLVPLGTVKICNNLCGAEMRPLRSNTHTDFCVCQRSSPSRLQHNRSGVLFLTLGVVTTQLEAS